MSHLQTNCRSQLEPNDGLTYNRRLFKHHKNNQLQIQKQILEYPSRIYVTDTKWCRGDMLNPIY